MKEKKQPCMLIRITNALGPFGNIIISFFMLALAPLYLIYMIFADCDSDDLV